MGLAALVAMVRGIVYVAWRAFTTMDNAHIVSGSVLLAAELLAVAVFALRVRSARSTPVTAIDAPGCQSTNSERRLSLSLGSKEATTSPSSAPAKPVDSV